MSQKETLLKWTSRLFIGGNVTLLVTSVTAMDTPKIITALILTSISSLYPLAGRNPKWFGVIGGGLITAQGIIAATAQGAGVMAQRTGAILPAIQGGLMIRKAFTSAAGKTFKTSKPLLKPLEWIDARPILSGSLIEGPGVALIALGAGLSGEIGLCVAASLWTLGNVCLGASDVVSKDLSQPTLKP